MSYNKGYNSFSPVPVTPKHAMQFIILWPFDDRRIYDKPSSEVLQTFPCALDERDLRMARRCAHAQQAETLREITFARRGNNLSKRSALLRNRFRTARQCFQSRQG